MPDRTISLYRSKAHAFDRARDRSLFERPWLERFAAGLPAGGRVLDIGCGAGDPIARWLIGQGLAVTGVDASEPLLAMAGERLPTAEWVAADMRGLDLGRRFDGLIAWHSLFHLSAADQRAMFVRFAAHARPAAMLMFTSGPEAGECSGEFEGEPLYHASLAPAEYRSLLATHGFAVVAHSLRDRACGDATVWLARKEA